MYTPAAFRLSDPALITWVLCEHAFANLCVGTATGLEATHLPLVYDEARQVLMGHLARNNPVLRALADGHEALAIFSGPHAYISPCWYGQPDVPTWNYVAVHVRGRARMLAGDEAAEAMARITGVFDDAKRVLGNLSAARLAGMQRGIGIFELAMTQVEAKAKLSQDRSAEDRARIAEALRQCGDLTLAGWMEMVA